MPNVNLTKPTDDKLSKPMLDLVKKADTALAKYNLTAHRAAVSLILDWSGSMDHLYRSGQIQRLVERFVALGHRFDDDGQIDLFAYHTSGGYIGTLSAVDCADVEGRIRKVMGGMGGTRYDAGISAFRRHAFGAAGHRAAPHKADLPHYVGFITDGQTSNEDACIEQIRNASYEPAFFQCIALGADYDPQASAQPKKGFMGRMFGSNAGADVPYQFEFLAELDSKVPGRFVDNVGFFATRSPDALSDEAFLDRMMGEYPAFLPVAKSQGLLA